ncbi:MAG TPA: hypothetical protein V6D22_18160 [Candidatus Obscuribacterales bacterium]
MQVPDSFWNAAQLVGGFALFCIGVSFTWKFIQAAFLGKVTYWSGLEKFGFLFIPITWFISPLLCHLPYDPKNSLIRTQQQLWVHLVWGPTFFVFALMFMTSGADFMKLPGSTSLNTILTLNRSDIPACIVYEPTRWEYGHKFPYKFPFLKKAARTVVVFLTHRVPEDKTQSYNAYDRRGDVDTEAYTKVEGPWAFLFYDDAEDKAADAAAAQQAAATPVASSHGGKRAR